MNGFGGSNLGPVMDHAVTAAAPPGWHVGVTGSQLLANGQPSAKGTGIMVEALLGGLGALVVLAFVFGWFLAVVPVMMAVASILTPSWWSGA